MNFQKAVTLELDRARKVHPGLIQNSYHGYAVILEEVRELEREVFKKDRDQTAMLIELIQVATTCQRMAEDLGILHSENDRCEITPEGKRAIDQTEIALVERPGGYLG